MMLLRPHISPVRLLESLTSARRYATVDSATIVARPPHPPISALHTPPTLDARLLAALSSSNPPRSSLPALISQYLESSGHVLDVSLPYESCPPDSRRVSFADADSEHGVAMVAHCVRDPGGQHRVAVCSGFALDVPMLGDAEGQAESVILTCAHTLEEIRWSPLLLPGSPAEDFDSAKAHASGTYIISGTQALTELHPVSTVLSALRRSDLLLLSKTGPMLSRTLPISPYPAAPETPIRAHFVADHCPPDEPGWTPWLGGTWSKWVRGTVLGYRDFAGREAQPGTYDALSHMMFNPPPTAGSSGGPIVDEQTGAVVGVMLGTRMDNRVEGMRGWGVPSETIFEMFSLPGLKLKSRQ